MYCIDEPDQMSRYACVLLGIYLSSLSLCASILQSAPLGQGASRLLHIFCLMRYGI